MRVRARARAHARACVQLHMCVRHSCWNGPLTIRVGPRDAPPAHHASGAQVSSRCACRWPGDRYCMEADETALLRRDACAPMQRAAAPGQPVGGDARSRPREPGRVVERERGRVVEVGCGRNRQQELDVEYVTGQRGGRPAARLVGPEPVGFAGRPERTRARACGAWGYRALQRGECRSRRA